MLVTLHIKNLAIIENLELDFVQQFNCLTGETGAGKSIIIDSLMLILGGRGSLDLIRDQATSCEVTATFDLTDNPVARAWLTEHDYTTDNAECILHRVLTREGRSKASINDRPVTLQTLRDFGTLLINIHGQHDNQLLLRRSDQLALLDAFAGHTELLIKIAKIANCISATQQQLDQLAITNQNSQQLEFLNYQLNEFNNLDCSEQHYNSLITKQKQLSHVTTLATTLNTALNLLTEDAEAPLLQQLTQLTKSLASCLPFDTTLQTEITQLENLTMQLQELASSMRHKLAALDTDPATLQSIEEELNILYKLALKHHLDPQQLATKKASLMQEIADYQQIDTKRQQLLQQLAEQQQEYLYWAQQLSKNRTVAAQQLALAVTEKIHKLAMPQGKFTISLIAQPPDKFSTVGLETVDFLVALNPGQELHPLNKVASGGELSRISLAIRAITAQKQATPTLIFDEIDTGIGGTTAHSVGELIQQLAQHAQILCVTHLTQLAARAQQHFLITKQWHAQKTQITVTSLTAAERLNELARMLGGITPASLAHAQELLAETSCIDKNS